MVAVVLMALAADWTAVATLPAGTRVEVIRKDHSLPMAKGTVVRGSADSLVVLAKSGEISVPVPDVEIVKVAAPQRRTRNGLIGLAAGAAAGFAVGTAICPYCSNEGNPGFAGQGAALGAGLGALAFLPLPYRTIYKVRRK